MNKELECLKRIDTKNYLTEREHREFYSVVEGALIKAQENKTDIIHYKGTVDNLRRDNALLKDIKNEQEKVLKIIFEKKIVDIKWLKASRDYKEYNSKMLDIYDLSSFLTDEEYDLLKRYYNEHFYKG